MASTSELEARVSPLEERVEEHCDRITALEKRINGNGEFGLSQKINIMWKVFIFLLALISSALGIAYAPLIHSFLQHFVK